MGGILPGMGPVHSDAKPDEIAMSKNLYNVAKSVVPAVAPSRFESQRPEGKIDIIMNHNQIPRINTEGSIGGADTGTAEIHKSLR